LVKQALDLAMVILDQLDNICRHVPSPQVSVACPHPLAISTPSNPSAADATSADARPVPD
jgi:hypothetical protein